MTSPQLSTLFGIHSASIPSTHGANVMVLMENELVYLDDDGHLHCTVKGQAYVRQLCQLEPQQPTN